MNGMGQYVCMAWDSMYMYAWHGAVYVCMHAWGNMYKYAWHGVVSVCMHGTGQYV